MANERKTLRDMIQATKARQNTGGIVCPKCECPDTTVHYTRKGNGRVKRVRVCEHCGNKIPTFEVAE